MESPFLLAIAAYVIPSLVARSRRHVNRNAIYALNLLGGWTFIGWVVALVWALTSNIESHTIPDQTK